MATQRGIIAGRAYVILDAVDNTAHVLRRVQANMMQFGNRIQNLGMTMITRGIMAATPAAISMKIFSDFDDAMRRVEARSSGTADQLAQVREQAMYLGRTTAFTARMIANLQAILAQRGFSRAQLLEMTPHVMTLARAGGTGNREQDILASADLVSAGLRAFNIQAKDSQTVADLFTAAVNTSNYSLVDLIVSMGNAGPIANQFQTGISGLAEALASLAVMRNVAVDPSIAGTGFRNLLLKASDVKRRTEFNQALAEATGKTIEFVDAHGNLRHIPDILFSIADAVKDLGTAEKGTLLANLFGLRAITPAGALSNAREDFNRVTDAFHKGGNLANRTAKLMDAGVGGSFRILISATEGLAIMLGDALAPAVMHINDVLTEVQNKTSVWGRRNKLLLNSIHMVIVGTIVLGGALVAVAMGIKLVATLLTPLIAAVTLITSAFTGMVAIVHHPIGAIAAVLFYMHGGFTKAREAIQSLYKEMKMMVSGMLTILTFAGGGVAAALRSGQFRLAWRIAIEGLKLEWMQFKFWMLDMWEDLLFQIKEKLRDANLTPTTWTNWWEDYHKIAMGTGEPGEYLLGETSARMRAEMRKTDRDQMAANQAERISEFNDARRDLMRLTRMIRPSRDVMEDIVRRLTSPMAGLEAIGQVRRGNMNLVRSGIAGGGPFATPLRAVEHKTGKALEAYFKNLQRVYQKNENVQQQQLSTQRQIEINTRNLGSSGQSVVGV